MTINTAKPCPFCGSRPSAEPWWNGKLTRKGADPAVMLICSEPCPIVIMCKGPTEAEALAKWNTRA